MNKEVIVATKNAGKLSEFKRILAPYGFDVKSMGEIGLEINIEENGKSFSENSAIKSKAVWEHTKSFTLADDSGLSIDALDGAPGIYSARYMGEDTCYSVKNRGILTAMSTFPDNERTARFVCAIALTNPEGETKIFEESCEGIIGYQPLGEGGFGYDPIFMVGEYSFAELSAEEKDTISHRGKALRALCEYFGG